MNNWNRRTYQTSCFTGDMPWVLGHVPTNVSNKEVQTKDVIVLQPPPGLSIVETTEHLTKIIETSSGDRSIRTEAGGSGEHQEAKDETDGPSAPTQLPVDPNASTFRKESSSQTKKEKNDSICLDFLTCCFQICDCPFC